MLRVIFILSSLGECKVVWEGAICRSKFHGCELISRSPRLLDQGFLVFTNIIGPSDLTVPGFGVPIGSAYLSARRTFGRPKVRTYLRPAESTAVPSASQSAGRRYGLIRHPPL